MISEPERICIVAYNIGSVLTLKVSLDMALQTPLEYFKDKLIINGVDFEKVEMIAVINWQFVPMDKVDVPGWAIFFDVFVAYKEERDV